MFALQDSTKRLSILDDEAYENTELSDVFSTAPAQIVTHMCFNAAGTKFAASFRETGTFGRQDTIFSVQIWNLVTHESIELSSVDVRYISFNQCHSHDWLLIRSSTVVKIFDLVTSRILHEIQTETSELHVLSACFSLDDNMLFVPTQFGIIKVFGNLQVGPPSVVADMIRHTDDVRKVLLHPVRDVLASCGNDGKIVIWDIHSFAMLYEISLEGMVTCICFSQNATNIVASTSEKKVFILSFEQDIQIIRQQCIKDIVSDVQINSRETQLALKLWSRRMVCIVDIESFEIIKELDTTFHCAFAFSPISEVILL